MIVIKDNVERIIADEDMPKFVKLGFHPLNKADIKHESGENKLEELTVPNLKAIAKEKGIKDISSLNKQELLKVLRDAG